VSLYNALFGENPFSGILLGLLGLSKEDFYRYRDCYLVADDEGEQIAVHTRGGGNNREDNDTDVSDHSCYLYDEDDSFDCTYCTYYFSIPDSGLKVLEVLKNESELRRSPEESWNKLFTSLEKGDRTDPMVQNAIEVGKQIFADISKEFEKEKEGPVVVKV